MAFDIIMIDHGRYMSVTVENHGSELAAPVAMRS